MATTPYTSEKAGLRVPEHIVPPPSTVSPQAQAFLAQRMAELGLGPAEPVGTEDKEEWRRYIAESNAVMTVSLAASAEHFPAEIITHALENTVLYEVVPANLDPELADAAIF